MDIIENIKEVLRDNTLQSKDISKIKGYIEVSKLYDSLVESGITSRRGNHLASKDKTHQPNIRFNV